MPTALISGVHGFAGSYLCANLIRSGYSVVGVDRNREPSINLDPTTHGEIKTLQSDFKASESVLDFISSNQVDCIFHLAGSAFVPDSWVNPAAFLENNAMKVVELLHALRERSWQGRFLLVSSGDVYGLQDIESQPYTENSKCHPESPYAEAKIAAEKFARYYNRDGIEVLTARPFNHIGPGQRDIFVVPAFLSRIQESLTAGRDFIETGDLGSERDFTDVRDVVEGYRTIMEKGQAGEIYNICSGKRTSIEQILNLCQQAAGTQMQVRLAAQFTRKEGNSVRYGSSDKLQSLGWQVQHPLDRCIQDMWDYANGNEQ